MAVKRAKKNGSGNKLSAIMKRGTLTLAPPLPVPQVEIKPSDLRMIEAPIFHVSHVNVQATGNDILLVFSRPRPTVLQATGEISQAGLMEPAVILTMSPQTAKDLSIILPNIVLDLEKQFGELQSPFTQRAASA